MVRQAGRAGVTSHAGTGGRSGSVRERARRPVAESRAPWTGDIVIAAERANWNACPLRPIGTCPLRRREISDHEFSNV